MKTAIKTLVIFILFTVPMWGQADKMMVDSTGKHLDVKKYPGSFIYFDPPQYNLSLSIIHKAKGDLMKVPTLKEVIADITSKPVPKNEYIAVYLYALLKEYKGDCEKDSVIQYRKGDILPSPTKEEIINGVRITTTFDVLRVAEKDIYTKKQPSFIDFMNWLGTKLCNEKGTNHKPINGATNEKAFRDFAKKREVK